MCGRRGGGHACRGAASCRRVTQATAGGISVHGSHVSQALIGPARPARHTQVYDPQSGNGQLRGPSSMSEHDHHSVAEAHKALPSTQRPVHAQARAEHMKPYTAPSPCTGEG